MMRNKKQPGFLDRLLKNLQELSDDNSARIKQKRKYNPGTKGLLKGLQGVSNANTSRIKQERKSNSNIRQCSYWNCTRNIRSDHFLCTEHYKDWENYIIDKCPACGRYKDTEYELCKECNENNRKTAANKTTGPVIRREHSRAWEKEDKSVDKFFVYILKDDRRKFYIGQTRDLRVRLREHKDGKTKSTAGRNMKLQYFEEVADRDIAESREAALKELLRTNERKMRVMIQEFQDRVREVQIG